MNETTQLQEVADLVKQIFTEGIHASQWQLIETYHAVGRAMTALPDPYKSVSAVAQLSGKSERTIYRCVQFVKKYPDINALPDGKVITWNKIITKYLPAPKDEEPCEHEWIEICRKCRKTRNA
jgi:hypothetical protein